MSVYVSKWLRRMFAPAIGRRGFARNERGAVAVEFAILALPFFTLIFAILETSIVFLAGQILDSAVQDASRFIRTGQAQNSSWSANEFRTQVCDRLYGLFDCNNVKIKVSVVSNFASATVTNPIDPDCSLTSDPSDCNWTLTESYDDGAGSSVVLVQAHYKWPTVINLPGFNLATQAGNTRLLSAVRVFRNEPF